MSKMAAGLCIALLASAACVSSGTPRQGDDGWSKEAMAAAKEKYGPAIGKLLDLGGTRPGAKNPQQLATLIQTARNALPPKRGAIELPANANEAFTGALVQNAIDNLEDIELHRASFHRETTSWQQLKNDNPRINDYCNRYARNLTLLRSVVK